MPINNKISRSTLNEIKQVHDYIQENPNAAEVQSEPTYKRTAITAAARWTLYGEGNIFIQESGYRHKYPSYWNDNPSAFTAAFARAFVNQEKAKESGAIDNLSIRGRPETPKTTVPITPVTQSRFRQGHREG